MRPSRRAIRIFFLALFLWCIVSLDLFADEYMICTIAGNGIAGYSGDGGPATSAKLNYPSCVFVDAHNNIYIADTRNCRIRKVDALGIITTVTGNAYGNSGNGGPAISASLKAPEGLCTDSEGNLYIADYMDCRIRMVDKTGLIDVFAGAGTSGFSGDGGPATTAELNSPDRIFMDGKGNLYIADELNNRIRKVDSSGMISTFAGGKSARIPGKGEGGLAVSAYLPGPVDVTVDNEGNVYIADRYEIFKVDTAGTITTIAGNGNQAGDGVPASSASLSTPVGISVDADGNIYIVEAEGHRIRKVDSYGFITTIAGTGESGYSGDGGPANSAKLNRPVGVFVDHRGNVFIADRGNNVIRKLYISK